jgi:hypothetical protein
MKHGSLARLGMILFFGMAFSAVGGAQAQLAGDWQGTLTANGTPFRIVWHVTADSGGILTSTLDNLDQGIFGIKVKWTSVKGSTLTLSVDDTVQINGEAVQVIGSYVGTLSADSTGVSGIWSQSEPQEPPAQLDMKHVPAVMTADPATPAAAAQQVPVPIPSPAPGPSPEPTPGPAAEMQQRAQIAGDWQGSISAGPMQLRLVLHIHAAPDGSLSGTLDSVDQGALGLPISGVAVKDTAFSFNVDTVHGSYAGTISKDGSGIDGTWTQGMPIPLNFKRAAAQTPKAEAKPAAPSEIDGSWMGTLDAGVVKMRVIFKFTNTADGLTAVMQSPDQSLVWINATSVAKTGNTVTINFSGLGASYSGKISEDKSSIDGSFTQMGLPLPLIVKRSKE